MIRALQITRVSLVRGTVSFFLLLPLWLSTAAVSAAQEVYELSGEAAAIWNLAGTVSVTGGGSAVTVRVRRGGADAGRLEIGTGAIDLDDHDVGRVDALRIVYPDDDIVYGSDGRETNLRVRDDGTFYRGEGWRRGRKVTISGRGRGLDAYADLEIRVPTGHTVLLYLAVGEVDVTNVSGDLVIDVGAANVRSTGTRGSLLIDTASGEIELDGAIGEVSLDTGSGAVRATNVREGNLLIDTGSGSVTGSAIGVRSLNVDTGSGRVDLSSVEAREVEVDTGSGGVRLGFESSPRDVSVDTGSGDVILTFPPFWSAEIELDTSSGSIDSDFSIQVRELDDDYLRGRVGDGDGSLEIDTGSGNIRLRRT